MNVTDASKQSSLWSALKEAVHGSQQDFTRGPLGRAILLLAVPMVLEMVMESVFAIVDVFVVSRLGADAVATVGLTESMLTLIYAVAIGLSIGATAVVARRIGERDPESAARAAVQAIIIAVLAAIPMSLAGIFLARPLLGLMGASPWILEHGVTYTRVMLGSAPIILLIFLVNAIFRGAGDAAIAMRVLWLANGINIILGPTLVLGLGFGVEGAAIATACGRGTGVLYQLWRLCRPGGRIRIERRHLVAEGATMIQMLRLSGSGMIQVLIGMTSWVFLVRIISGFGSAAVAGYTIAIRMVIFALLPSWGLANAAATLMGQNLGAQQPERARQAVWTASRWNMAFLGIVGVIFFVFADLLVGFFSRDPHVHPIGVACLRIVSVGFVFYALGMVLSQAFNGAGDTWTPTWINLLCFWIVELPLAWVLAHKFHVGPNGAFWAIMVCYTLMAVTSAYMFRKGKWMLRKV
ncbi:MAG TPA: MATE family efflux transporter [Planctomycetota bacterium]|nr:MATE family efflux transporter [Planctomycetota bacterium]